MIKNIISSLIFLFLASSSSALIAEPITVQEDIPSQFFVNERIFSFTTTFDIETKHKKIGIVDRKFFSFTLEYDFYDIYDQLQAKAKQRFFSFGAIFDITDVFGRPIGIVEERLSWFFPTFTIISPYGEILAEAELNFWGTKYTVTSPYYKEPIATLSRSFFRFKDDWTVNIHNPDAFRNNFIDPRLFILVMAFQTDVDYWKKQQAQNEQYAAKSMPEHTPSQSINHDALQSELQNFKDQSEEFSQNISEDRISELEQLTDQYLQKLAIPMENTQEKFEIYSQALLELMRENVLTPEEKGTLYFMLQERLKVTQQ